MPGFYRKPPAPNALIGQGDIFIDVPIIGVSLSQLRRVVEVNGALQIEPVEPDAITPGTVLMEHVTTTNAMVVSQSCDAERAPRLLLVPLSDFKPDGSDAATQWKSINRVATSLGEPKNIYLPGNPALGLRRSLADFGEAFTLPREFLLELARRGKRVAGLSEHAAAFLQFRLGVLLTRLAQDDYSWPSKEDLELKVAGLALQIGKMEKKLSSKRTEAEKAEGDKKTEMLLEVGEYETDIEHLKAMRVQATEALATADSLE